MTDFANLGLRFVPVDDAAANKALTDVAANSTKAESATKKLTATQAAAANAQKAVAQAAQAQAAAVGQMGEAMQVAAAQQAASIKAMESAAALHGKVAGATKITAAETLNLSRQFADVAVTGAMGMSPLMILIQQGPQIGETIGAISTRAGGMSAALKLVAISAWEAVAPFAPFIAAAGLLAAAIGGPLLMATHELNKGNDDLQKRLGLTEEQMKKAGNTAVTVSDVIQGVFKYAAEAISRQFAPQLTWLQKAFAAAYEFIKNATVSAVKVFAGLWGAQIAVIQALWHNVKAFMKGEPLIDVNDAALKGFAEGVSRVERGMSGLAVTIREVRDARVLEAAGTAEATKELKDHTKALKDQEEALDRTQPITADMSKAVDLTEVKAVKMTAAIRELNGELKQMPVYVDPATTALEDLQRATDNVSYSIGDMFSSLKRGDFGGFIANIQSAIEGISKLASLSKSAAVAQVGSVIANTIGGKTGAAIGGGLGIAASGLGLGAFAASSAGAATLATLGLGSGVIGSIAALAGPLGIAAAALYAAVKLFNVGGKPTNAGAGFDLTTGALSGNKRTQETEDAARSAGESIRAIEAALKEAGLGLTDAVRGLVIGTRDETQIYLASGKELRSAVGDAGAAVDTAMRALLDGATYASDAQRKLVEAAVAAGKGFDGVSEVLTRFKAAQEISGALADEILRLTDPKAFDLKGVQDAIAAQRTAYGELATAGYLTAEQFATITDQLTTLERLQIDEVMARFADKTDELADAARASMKAFEAMFEAQIGLAAKAAQAVAYDRRARWADEAADRAQAMAATQAATEAQAKLAETSMAAAKAALLAGDGLSALSEHMKVNADLARLAQQTNAAGSFNAGTFNAAYAGIQSRAALPLLQEASLGALRIENATKAVRDLMGVYLAPRSRELGGQTVGPVGDGLGIASIMARQGESMARFTALQDQWFAGIIKGQEATDLFAEAAEDAGAAITRAGLDSLGLYFRDISTATAELNAQAALAAEPISQVAQAIGRLNSIADVFTMSANAALGAGLTPDVEKAALIAQSAAIASQVMITADAAKIAEKIAGDAAFGALSKAGIRDAAMLLDGLKGNDARSFEAAFLRINNALVTGAVNQEQYQVLFGAAMDTFEGLDEKVAATAQTFADLRLSAQKLAADLRMDAGINPAGAAGAFAASQDRYEGLFSSVLGGNVGAFSDFASTAQAMLSNAKSTFATGLEYDRLFGRTLNDVDQLATLPTPQAHEDRMESLAAENNAELKALKATVQALLEEQQRSNRSQNQNGRLQTETLRQTVAPDSGTA